MINQLRILMVLFAFIALTGCAENQTRIAEGAGIGGILGAGAGAIIGHQTHNDLAGVLIGGAVGAAGGAAVGSQITKNPPVMEGNSTVRSIEQVTIKQIVDWTQDGIPSDTIIQRIQSTHSVYALTKDDLDYLRRQGVSQRVVETMQTSRQDVFVFKK